MSSMNECGSWFKDVSEGDVVTAEQRRNSAGLGRHVAFEESEEPDTRPTGLGLHTSWSENCQRNFC